MLFMVSSGWHSVFIEHQAGPVGNKLTHYPVNHHFIRRKYTKYWKVDENLIDFVVGPLVGLVIIVSTYIAQVYI